jgi:hypothetical protein
MHVLEAGGRRGPGKISSGRNKLTLGSLSTSLRLEVAWGLGKSSAGKNRCFWLFPKFRQIDWFLICNFCAKFKWTQSTQNMSKEGWEVTVNKFRTGLVLNIGGRWHFLSISSRQKSSEKVKNGRFLYSEATADCFDQIEIFHLPT